MARLIHGLNPSLKLHAAAIAVGHAVSPAAFAVMTGNRVLPCTHCGLEPSDFHHDMWRCERFPASRGDLIARDTVQMQLGWPMLRAVLGTD